MIIIFGTVCAFGIDAQEPLFRAGIMTDTHIEKTEESCRYVKKAFEFFREKKTDMIIHLGDLADRHYPEGYRIYRRYFDEIFRDQRPQEIILYTDHDQLDCSDYETFVREFQEELKIPHKPYDKRIVNGYPFLIFPQSVEKEFSKMEEIIEQAIRDYPDKPIFVLHHCPMFNTVSGSRAGLCLEGRLVLDKYPQVVHLSGHTHGSLRNENNIHQDTYTTVNAGCLQLWQGNLVGKNLSSKRNDEVMIMEVYSQKLLFRRYTLSDNSEIGAENPWAIPLPFDPKTAPYNPERRKASAPVPAFPKNSAITLRKDGSPFRSISFSFPDAHSSGGCYFYRVELERERNGRYESFACKEDYSDFYLKKKREYMEIDFNSGFFEPGEKYRVKITPVNFFGGGGIPLRMTFTAGNPQKGKVVFFTDNPSRDCIYTAKKGTSIPGVDGWYLFSDRDSLGELRFPENIYSSVSDGSILRITVELEQIQPEFPRKRFWIGKGDFKRASSDSIFLREGKTSRERIVFDVRKKANEHYTLLVSHGVEPGPIRFHSVKIEDLGKL
ncbi:MAG: metallophosphoesterase [Victivallales bacterium]|jgi:predicted phosphodiesterase|nr:metallophosphoesterase [Victivallales bacterium]